MRLRSPWLAPIAPPGSGLLLTLAWVLLVGSVFLSVNANRCFIGQERDPTTNRLRWALPYKYPCRCPFKGPELGGFNRIQPSQSNRPFDAPYFDAPLELSEIKKRLNCPGEYVCAREEPLGMADGRIAADRITASSSYRRDYYHVPQRARLNTQGYAAAWCADEIQDPSHPWIQVDFSAEVNVTGLITQARGSDHGNSKRQRVTRYNVACSSDGESWEIVAKTNGMPIEFAGNPENAVNYDEQVTARFETVLRTRYC